MRLSVSERVDIVVDFASPVFGNLKSVFLVNQLEQVNGRGPTGKVLSPGTPITRIDRVGGAVADPSNPGLAVTGAAQPGIPLRPLPLTDAQLAAAVAKARVRTFEFNRSNGAWQVNGKVFDPDVITANPAQEAEEVLVIRMVAADGRIPSTFTSRSINRSRSVVFRSMPKLVRSMRACSTAGATCAVGAGWRRQDIHPIP